MKYDINLLPIKSSNIKNNHIKFVSISVIIIISLFLFPIFVNKFLKKSNQRIISELDYNNFDSDFSRLKEYSLELDEVYETYNIIINNKKNICDIISTTNKARDYNIIIHKTIISDDYVSIEGEADSFDDLANYYLALLSNEYITDTNLEEIKLDEHSSQNHFYINFRFN